MGSPAWSQQVCDTREFALSSPTVRFQDHGDGTVTDMESQLMWMRCSSGQQLAGGNCSGEALRLTWSQAQEQAEQVNRQGRFFFNDWRLPALRELATISERQCKNPRINAFVFPGTPAAAFWTATPPPGRTAGTALMALVFGEAGLQVLDKKDAGHLRLVRGAR